MARDTDKRCPQCKSRDFTVTYVDMTEHSARVRDGKWIEPMVESCMPVRDSAHGKCARCNHGWKFQNLYIDNPPALQETGQ